jgi:fructose-1,6-bisphosphatase I
MIVSGACGRYPKWGLPRVGLDLLYCKRYTALDAYWLLNCYKEGGRVRDNTSALGCRGCAADTDRECFVCSFAGGSVMPVNFEQTFHNYLMAHQEKHNRSYHFLILMDSIITAAKRIELYYRTGALKGNLGVAGSINVHGESVMKMDDIAHEIVAHYLASSERVIQVVSEEWEHVIDMNIDGGRYFVYLDPLDGSSNVAHGLQVGFMFGIAKCNLDDTPEDFHLRPGREYIAAGMFVFPTGMFTLALHEAGCWRFHSDEIATYVKPVQMTLPDSPETWEMSFNASYTKKFSSKVQSWVEENINKYRFRYIGALAGDFHRLLANGGLFMSPAIVHHSDPQQNRPQGKLRLMYEANVVAFMCKEAGGDAIDENGTPILDIIPSHHHQRTTLYVGSKPVIDDLKNVLKG